VSEVVSKNENRCSGVDEDRDPLFGIDSSTKMASRWLQSRIW